MTHTLSLSLCTISASQHSILMGLSISSDGVLADKQLTVDQIHPCSHQRAVDRVQDSGQREQLMGQVAFPRR